jgi:hypothetical protein
MATKPKQADAHRVVVENINVPGRSSRVEATRYNAMREALLQALPKQAPGLTQAEMLQALLEYLPEELFPGGAKAGWWMKSVQLDLEAKGVVVREASKPLRWHQQ